MVRNILFDIDDTLFPTTEFAERARRNAVIAMKSFGVKESEGKLYSMLLKIIKEKGSNYNFHFNELCKKLKIKDSSRFVAAAVAAYHNTKTSIQTYPEVPMVLLRLREKGYRIYVATNGEAVKQWDKLIRLRIALYFEDVFVSEELKSEKGRAFYTKVLKRLRAKPGDCLMVGDREDADIMPAKRLGIHTVKVRRGRFAKEPTSAEFTVTGLEAVPDIAAKLSRH